MTSAGQMFSDGKAYERMMGRWSKLAGRIFLDWLDAPQGLHWVEVGCGNGAFTEELIARCAPRAVDAVDPSEGQLAFARTRPASRVAKFTQGDAMALPYPKASFDVATMALVIFFVPDPAKGVAEMARVLRPGGLAAAYAWDMHGGGFPWTIVQKEIAALGHKLMFPPSADASRIDAMRTLWQGAGFADVETRAIAVQRTFDSVDEFLSIGLNTPSIGPIVKAMPSNDVESLKTRLREQLPIGPDGRIAYEGFANAVSGRAPI